MSWLGHHAREGFVPFQDHREKGSDGEYLAFRAARYGVRIVDRDKDGGWIADEGTVGDLHGAFLFKAGGQRRPISGWSYAWPSMVDKSSGGATTPSDSQIQHGVNDFRTPGGSYFGSGQSFTSFGPMGGFASSQGSGLNRNFGGTALRSRGSYPTRLLPIRDNGGAAKTTGGGNVGSDIHTFDPTAPGAFGIQRTNETGSRSSLAPDSRFQTETMQLSGPWPRFLPGSLGIIGAATNEDRQVGVFLPTDPRLLAPHHGGDQTYASLVCDLKDPAEIDDTRTARIHGFWRVIAGPGGSGSSLNFQGENILAWQFAPTDLDGVGGYGAIFDAADKRRGEITPKIDAGEVFYHTGYTDIGGTGGLGAGKVTTDGQGNQHVKTVTIPIVAGETFKSGGTKAVGLTSFLGAGGPLDVGSENDQHRHGVDADGNTINSTHIPTHALFRRPGTDRENFDGPLEFVTAEYTGVVYPITTRAEIRWRSKSTHQWMGQTKKGQWEIQATAPIGGTSSPPKKVITPRLPNDPPVRPPAPPVITPPDPPKPPPVTTPSDPIPTGIASPFSGALGGGTTVPVLSKPTNPSPLSSYSARGAITNGVEYAPFGTTPTPGGRNGGPPEINRRTLLRPGSVRAARLTGAREDSDPPEDDLHTFQTMAFPAWLAMPPSLNAAHPNLRSAPGVAAHQFFDAEYRTPVVARIEAFGKQTPSGEWSYAQTPGLYRYLGGTAAGGLALMPPEQSIDDYANSFSRANLTPSAAYFIAVPGAYWGAGYPVPSTGGMKSGWRWYSNSAGKLFFESMDSAGTATEWFSILASGVTHMKGGIHETATISPAQLVANTDNWSPTGLATTRTIRLSTDASRDLTGIDISVFDTPQGVRLRLVNVGAQNLVLKNNVTSDPANRFSIGADFTLSGGLSADLWYDSTSSKWRFAA